MSTRVDASQQVIESAIEWPSILRSVGMLVTVTCNLIALPSLIALAKR